MRLVFALGLAALSATSLAMKDKELGLFNLEMFVHGEYRLIDLIQEDAELYYIRSGMTIKFRKGACELGGLLKGPNHNRTLEFQYAGFLKAAAPAVGAEAGEVKPVTCHYGNKINHYGWYADGLAVDHIAASPNNTFFACSDTFANVTGLYLMYGNPQADGAPPSGCQATHLRLNYTETAPTPCH